MFFSPFIVPVGIAFAVALAVVFTGPIGKALGQRIAGRGVGGSADPELQRELEHALQRLGDAETRIVELEERVDFAERLLQQRAEPRLGP